MKQPRCVICLTSLDRAWQAQKGKPQSASGVHLQHQMRKKFPVHPVAQADFAAGAAGPMVQVMAELAEVPVAQGPLGGQPLGQALANPDFVESAARWRDGGRGKQVAAAMAKVTQALQAVTPLPLVDPVAAGGFASFVQSKLTKWCQHVPAVGSQIWWPCGHGRGRAGNPVPQTHCGIAHYGFTVAAAGHQRCGCKGLCGNLA